MAGEIIQPGDDPRPTDDRPGPTPTLLGYDMHEDLWILRGSEAVAVLTHDGTEVIGALFVRPQDGSVVFRQTVQGES